MTSQAGWNIAPFSALGNTASICFVQQVEDH